MKRILAILFVALVSFALNAQDITTPVIPAQVDSSLLGKSIFSALPANVKVNQSQKVRQAFDGQIIGNADKQFNGYRIRIYYNSVQNARAESNSVLARFQNLYPEIPASLSYASPNFRVIVGDFRTRVDAERALVKIKEDFPSATIIRDRFKYPAL